MKALIFTAMVAFASVACAKEEPKKVDGKTPEAVTAPAENTNCVKKDKNGKCPPLPKSPKPTPKKPAETK